MQCHSLSLYSLAFSISTYLDSALVPTSNFKWHKLFITGNLVLHTREKPKLCRCSKACGCIFLCPSHMTLFHSGYNLPGLFTSNTVCQSIQEQQWLALNTELKASKLEGISGLWRPGCLLFVYADPVIQLLASMATPPPRGPNLVYTTVGKFISLTLISSLNDKFGWDDFRGLFKFLHVTTVPKKWSESFSNQADVCLSQEAEKACPKPATCKDLPSALPLYTGSDVWARGVCLPEAYIPL